MITCNSASAFSLTTEGLGLVGRGREFDREAVVFPLRLAVSVDALPGETELQIFDKKFFVVDNIRIQKNSYKIVNLIQK